MGAFDLSAMDDELAEVIALHREMFAGWKMQADDDANEEGDEPEGDDAVEADEPEGDDGADDEPEGAESLGDPGKKALDAMKAKWHAEREKRRELEQRLNPPKDPQVDALAKATDRIRRAEIKAAAKGKLADPADAYRFLDLDQFEVSDDGDVDEDEIAAAIDDLLKSKPYLAAQGRRFQGSHDQGARKTSGPRQLSRADLAGMSPQQIHEAKAKGQLRDLLKTT